jgi:hypothetical protein
MGIEVVGLFRNFVVVENTTALQSKEAAVGD